MLVDVERWEWDYSITPHIYYGYMFRRYSFNCWWEKVLNAACIINAYGVYRNPTKMRYYCSKRVFCWQASIRDKIVETLYSNRVTTANKRIHTPPLHSKVVCCGVYCVRKWWKVKILSLQCCALHTVPLKSKLPVTSCFLCNKYSVPWESLKRQFLE